MSVAPSLTLPLRPRYRPVTLLTFAALLLVAVFWDGLREMLTHWASPEFSHGYLIPFVAAAIGFREWARRSAAPLKASTSGLIVFFVGLAAGGIGAIATSYSLVQYAFMISVVGLAAAALGWAGVRLFAPAILYLSFMIPLPLFFLVQLSAGLQLISTDLGVAILRLFSIPTFVEGNVIDLGDLKLQVAEACSGLRYLFPLMSFGFLVAYLYRGPFWQRTLLFLSTVPIAVLMNGLRIGIIGITVTRWGLAAAEGFLHSFEGWVVFLVCLAILLAEAALLARTTGTGTLFEKLDVEFPSIRGNPSRPGLRASWQVTSCIALLLLAAGLRVVVPHRADMSPARQAFELFPDRLGTWQGHRLSLDPSSLALLKLADYIYADYATAPSTGLVNLYVAYYAAQLNGAAIHSPHNCLPAGGWQVQSASLAPLGPIGPGGATLSANRVVVRKGQDRMLVYYWFQERGRIIAEACAA